MNPVLMYLPFYFQKCPYKFFECYLLEMNVVLHEENLIKEEHLMQGNIMKVTQTLEKFKKHVSKSTSITCTKTESSDINVVLCFSIASLEMLKATSM